MQRARWMAYVWPGLPELWFRGQWSGLLLAVFAALLVNFLLATSLVWTEWQSSTVRTTAAFMLAFTWVIGIYRSRRQLREGERLAASGAGEDLFRQAQNEYLRGNWFEAESVIHKLLRHCARDVDAHLMLATLYRHTGRLEESATQLRRLALFDDAQKWVMEIERERRRLELASQEQQVEDVHTEPADEATAHPIAEAEQMPLRTAA